MSKADKKQPWFKFYPQDWRGDAKLRMCSIGARGLWTEMLCVMHEAEPYGHLLINGAPVTNRQIAALAGIAAAECGRFLMELESAGVYSRTTDKTIFSRRMVRDKAKAEKDRENGKGGGNPRIKSDVNKGVNPPDNGVDKAQKLEAKFHKPEQQACAPIDEDLKRRGQAIASAISAHFLSRQIALPNMERCTTWLQQGYAQGTILAAVEAVLKRGTKPATLEYFDGAIRDAHAKAAPQLGGALVEATNKVFVEVGTPEWNAHLHSRGGRTCPITQHRVGNVLKDGWWFESLVPTGYDEATGEKLIDDHERVA